MNPLTLSIVVILAKYALDKGLELGKAVGPQALATAAAMFKLVLDRIGKKRPETAAEFPQDPETYEKPLQKALDAEIAADKAFAAKLETLLARYENASQEYGATTGVSYRATLSGDGAIAQGPGAMAVGREGSIRLGGEKEGKP